jgi:ATP-dependent DNA helicase RecQ
VPTATLDDARSVLQDRFGYPDFRPGQVDVVAAVLAGHDTLAVLPTGGGKSLCYQVPALVIPGLTVVISPLISLMTDQVDRLVSRGVPATFLNSTLEADEARARLAQVASGTLRLLYVAPERLAAPDLTRALCQRGVALLAVDEAHCISEWGHEFRPSFRRIAEVRETLGNPQAIALTATATPAVRRDITQQLRLRAPREIVGGFDRSNLDYTVLDCESAELKEQALSRVVRARMRPAIVYAPTRLAVERVAKRLTRSGIRTLAYHGGLQDSQRQEVQETFMRGGVEVIAATNAFGMGIDKPDVRTVVHFAMPGTLEAYYQEAGRGGRDGAPAGCVLLYHANDRLTHEWFVRGTFPPRDVVDAVIAAINGIRERDSVPDDPARIARSARGKVTARDARSVITLLEREELLTRPEVATSAWIRLLAMPARIRRELGPDAVEVAVLRALWRRGQEALQQGVVVDLRSLGPSLRPAMARRLLERLRARQFVDFALTDTALRVTSGNTRLTTDSLDWPRLERRRKTELRKLEMMEAYTRTTRCRRAFVLGYFGDRASATPCSGCDNCRRHATARD